ncbi:4'-phosphopantetheinyl transferase [Fomitopsis betulina]|nr:4'-phosphopantetheinyl transferase [Fomitopsis betulina]
MGILGIGVDILHAPRLAALAQRKSAARLASRILSQSELAVWNNMPTEDTTRLRFLAVRWCVKEAAYKALYPKARPTWKELTFLNDSSELHGKKPCLRYLPRQATFPSVPLHSSISHDGDYVFATVLAEDND